MQMNISNNNKNDSGISKKYAHPFSYIILYYIIFLYFVVILQRGIYSTWLLFVLLRMANPCATMIPSEQILEAEYAR